MTKKFLENNEIKLKILYEEMLEDMLDTVMRYEDAQVVASTMVALALRLYKTTLSESEFKDMLKVVIKNAKTIEPFVIKRMH